MAKRKLAKTTRKQNVSFTSMHFFGKKLHPVWSLVTGVVLSPWGGLLTIAGGILTVASVVALSHHYMKAKKK